jgi:hypothetical protein
MRLNSCSILLAIFPGYYTGRALHVHVKVFPDWQVLPNNTFRGGSLAHVGQFFFDDHLEAVIDEVRLLHNFPVDHLQIAGWIACVMRRIKSDNGFLSEPIAFEACQIPRPPIFSPLRFLFSSACLNSNDPSHCHSRCGRTEITPSATP